MPISRSFIDKDGEEIIVTVEDDERQECDVYSRVVGYLVPTNQYNIGKKAEWNDRKLYAYPDMPDPAMKLPFGQLD